MANFRSPKTLVLKAGSTIKDWARNGRHYSQEVVLCHRECNEFIISEAAPSFAFIAELNVEIALETVILTQNANFKGRNFGCFFRHIHRHTLSAS